MTEVANVRRCCKALLFRSIVVNDILVAIVRRYRRSEWPEMYDYFYRKFESSGVSYFYRKFESSGVSYFYRKFESSGVSYF